MTNKHSTNGNFLLVATWVMLIVALIGAGFALFGLYGPDSVYRANQSDVADLRTEVTTLRGTVEEQKTTIATLQGTINEHTGTVAALRTQLETTKQQLADRQQLYIFNPSPFNTDRVKFDNTLGWVDSEDIKFCDAGHYVCGINQLVEKELGEGKDDTAMNGMEFFCCALTR